MVLRLQQRALQRHRPRQWLRTSAGGDTRAVLKGSLCQPLKAGPAAVLWTVASMGKAGTLRHIRGWPGAGPMRSVALVGSGCICTSALGLRPAPQQHWGGREYGKHLQNWCSSGTGNMGKKLVLLCRAPAILWPQGREEGGLVRG